MEQGDLLRGRPYAGPARFLASDFIRISQEKIIGDVCEYECPIRGTVMHTDSTWIKPCFKCMAAGEPGSPARRTSENRLVGDGFNAHLRRILRSK